MTIQCLGVQGIQATPALSELDRADKLLRQCQATSALSELDRADKLLRQCQATPALSELDRADKLLCLSKLGGDQATFKRCLFDRGLHLFKRPHFDLTDALAADAILIGQVFQCHRVIAQATLADDMLFTLV